MENEHWDFTRACRESSLDAQNCKNNKSRQLARTGEMLLQDMPSSGLTGLCPMSALLHRTATAGTDPDT